jgi:hypothetical protein
MAAASVADQMAPARQGMMQCQMPDVLFKTCFSLSRIRQASPSTYIFETEMLVDETGPVTASMNSKVFVRGSELCEVMNPNEILEATITSQGHTLHAAQATKYRAKVRRTLAGFAGRTICTTIVAGDGEMQKVIGTVDGKRIPAADYAMKWVAPDDGWKVAP